MQYNINPFTKCYTNITVAHLFTLGFIKCNRAYTFSEAQKKLSDIISKHFYYFITITCSKTRENKIYIYIQTLNIYLQPYK